MAMRLESSAAASMAAGVAVAAAFALLLAAPPLPPAPLTAGTGTVARGYSSDSLMLLQVKAELQVKPDLPPQGTMARFSEALAKIWPKTSDSSQGALQSAANDSVQVVAALEVPHAGVHGHGRGHGQRHGQQHQQQQPHHTANKTAQHLYAKGEHHSANHSKPSSRVSAEKKDVPVSPIPLESLPLHQLEEAPQDKHKEGDVIDVRLSSELNQEAAEVVKADANGTSKPAELRGEAVNDALDVARNAKVQFEKQVQNAQEAAKAQATMTEEERLATELPTVSEVTHGSEHAFDLVKSQIASFSSRLGMEKTERQKQLAKHRAAYDHNLTEQRKVIRSLFESKEAVSKDVEALEMKNGQFRQKAAHLKEKNSLLEERLLELEQNIRLAAEFVQQAMGSSESNASTNGADQIITSPLAVLRELEVQENSEATDAAERRALDTIANTKAGAETGARGGAKKQKQKNGRVRASKAAAVSLLSASSPSEATAIVEAVAMDVAPAASDGDDVEAMPEALTKLRHDAVRSLEDGLETVRAETSSEEVSLEQAFVADYAAGDEKRVHVKDQVEELQAKRESLQALGQRLKSAVDSLAAEESRLEESTAAAAAYLAQMGGIPVPLLVKEA